jgi:hypothetical protein
MAALVGRNAPIGAMPPIPMLKTECGQDYFPHSIALAEYSHVARSG